MKIEILNFKLHPVMPQIALVLFSQVKDLDMVMDMLW